MKNNIKSLDINWLETNTDKSAGILLEEVSTQFDYDLVDKHLGCFIEEFGISTGDLSRVLVFILKYATEANHYKVKPKQEILTYRFLAACIALCNISQLSSTNSLRALCRQTNLDYFYLRRCIISFGVFVKKHNKSKGK